MARIATSARPAVLAPLTRIQKAYRGQSSLLQIANSAIARSFGSTSRRPNAAHSIPDRTDIYEGQPERGLRMLMFGKPGSGKGTLSGRLLKHYDISFVSTGDVLRQEIAQKSEIGRRAEDIVRSGGLVPDELMLEIVMAELDRLQGKSWIIDGFPRTLHQGSLLDKVLNEERRPFNMIVHIDVPDQVIMARIAARWVHLPSGRVYNTTFSAPKVPGKDDVTGEDLVQRPDDTPAVFSKRLEAYYGSTEPLLKYFATAYPNALKTLTGTTSDELWPQLQALVEPYGLRRAGDLSEDEVSPVRQKADDLREPDA